MTPKQNNDRQPFSLTHSLTTSGVSSFPISQFSVPDAMFGSIVEVTSTSESVSLFVMTVSTDKTSD